MPNVLAPPMIASEFSSPIQCKNIFNQVRKLREVNPLVTDQMNSDLEEHASSSCCLECSGRMLRGSRYYAFEDKGGWRVK